jgi:putative transposase
MSRNYKINHQEGIYYITFATVEWVDLFTRAEYRNILIDSLKFCQNHKGLQIFGWVIMSNHVHFILRSKSGDLSGTIRDFKKYTAVKLIQEISYNSKESRKDWMLDVFKKAGKSNSQNKNYQLWQQNNHPKEILPYSPKFGKQKLDYIHNNPINAGLVEKAEDYIYSSARDYAGIKGLIEIEFLY